MELNEIVLDIGAALACIDKSGESFRTFQPGVGPYGEPQLVGRIAKFLNGKEAENWSVNLLHPYPGNVSTIGDCYKLLGLEGPERKAVVVIGYEHVPPRISLTPLVESFEVLAKHVASMELSPRIETHIEDLIHPIHQSVRIFAWQVCQDHK